MIFYLYSALLVYDFSYILFSGALLLELRHVNKGREQAEYCSMAMGTAQWLFFCILLAMKGRSQKFTGKEKQP